MASSRPFIKFFDCCHSPQPQVTVFREFAIFSRNFRETSPQTLCAGGYESRLLNAGIRVQAVLNRYLLILSDRIFDSSVDAGTPNWLAAPEGPETRPPLAANAASM